MGSLYAGLLLMDIGDGLQRAAEFAQIVAKDGFAVAARHEDITGYPAEILHKLVFARSDYDCILLNYPDKALYTLKEHKLEWNAFLRVCRGVIFSRKGELLSFPFHKFFNVNEHPETADSEVARWKIRTITEKVDGVMIQVYEHNGELIFASRHGVWSNASITAYQLAHAQIQEVWKHIPLRKFTLICELIHPTVWQPGMINYGNLQVLVLLFVRDHNTLELIPCCEIFANGARNLPEPLVLPATYTDTNDYWSAKEKVKSAPNADWEGVVLQGCGALGNQLVKIKNPHYIARLALVKSVSPQKIINAYEKLGWDGVNLLVSGLEELLLAHTKIKQVLDALREAENSVRAEIEANEGKSVHELPTYLKWINTYPKGSEKYQAAFWRTVAHKVSKLLR